VEASQGGITWSDGHPRAPLPGYNAAGRGYPDISALAYNYVIAVNKNLTAGAYSISMPFVFQ
jgi:hypothetical protein